MPLILSDTPVPGISFSIWHITETEQELLQGLEISSHDLEAILSLRLEKRRKERIACRKALSCLLKTSRSDIRYGNSGEPLADGLNISFSHTAGYAGVTISDLFEVGIDMEGITPRILSLYPKFIGQEELPGVNIHDPEEITFYWCAKEAVYKIFPGSHLDFKEHIFIEKKTGKATVDLHGQTYPVNLWDRSLKDMKVVLAWAQKS